MADNVLFSPVTFSGTRNSSIWTSYDSNESAGKDIEDEKHSEAAFMKTRDNVITKISNEFYKSTGQTGSVNLIDDETYALQKELNALQDSWRRQQDHITKLKTELLILDQYDQLFSDLSTENSTAPQFQNDFDDASTITKSLRKDCHSYKHMRFRTLKSVTKVKESHEVKQQYFRKITRRQDQAAELTLQSEKEWKIAKAQLSDLKLSLNTLWNMYQQKLEVRLFNLEKERGEITQQIDRYTRKTLIQEKVSKKNKHTKKRQEQEEEEENQLLQSQREIEAQIAKYDKDIENMQKAFSCDELSTMIEKFHSVRSQNLTLNMEIETLDEEKTTKEAKLHDLRLLNTSQKYSLLLPPTKSIQRKVKRNIEKDKTEVLKNCQTKYQKRQTRNDLVTSIISALTGLIHTIDGFDSIKMFSFRIKIPDMPTIFDFPIIVNLLIKKLSALQTITSNRHTMWLMLKRFPSSQVTFSSANRKNTITQIKSRAPASHQSVHGTYAKHFVSHDNSEQGSYFKEKQHQVINDYKTMKSAEHIAKTMKESIEQRRAQYSQRFLDLSLEKHTKEEHDEIETQRKVVKENSQKTRRTPRLLLNAFDKQPEISHVHNSPRQRKFQSPKASLNISPSLSPIQNGLNSQKVLSSSISNRSIGKRKHISPSLSPRSNWQAKLNKEMNSFDRNLQRLVTNNRNMKCLPQTMKDLQRTLSDKKKHIKTFVDEETETKQLKRVRSSGELRSIGRTVTVVPSPTAERAIQHSNSSKMLPALSRNAVSEAFCRRTTLVFGEKQRKSILN